MGRQADAKDRGHQGCQPESLHVLRTSASVVLDFHVTRDTVGGDQGEGGPNLERQGSHLPLLALAPAPCLGLSVLPASTAWLCAAGGWTQGWGETEPGFLPQTRPFSFSALLFGSSSGYVALEVVKVPASSGSPGAAQGWPRRGRGFQLLLVSGSLCALPSSQQHHSLLSPIPCIQCSLLSVPEVVLVLWLNTPTSKFVCSTNYFVQLKQETHIL